MIPFSIPLTSLRAILVGPEGLQVVYRKWVYLSVVKNMSWQ